MKEVNIDIESKLDEIVDAIGNNVIERARRNLAVTRTRTGYRTEKGVTRTYKYKGKVDATGTLSKSLSFNAVKRKGIIEIKFYGKGTQKYADVVENGRRPNSKQPPTKAIESWIKQKPLRLRTKSGKYKTTSELAVKQIAYLIARKIGKYGTEPIHYWKDAIEAEMEINFAQYEEEIKKYIELKINEGWL